MSLDISLTIEARLAAKARAEGLSVDSLLEKLIGDSGDLSVSDDKTKSSQLPVWRLGVKSDLHRRDIYEDVS